MRIERQAAAALFAAIALSAMACDPVQPVESFAVDTDPACWDVPAEFRFENRDTAGLCDLSLFLRCDERFREDTLAVRVVTETPDSLRCEERHLLVFPRSERPAARAQETIVPYRRNVRFDRAGRYRITIVPGRPVEGVEAVGIVFNRDASSE